MSAGLEALQARLTDLTQRHRNLRLFASHASAPPCLVIRVDGELETQSSGDFQRVIQEAFGEAKERGGLLLDLSALQYISSTGVGSLTTLLVETQRHRIPFYLCKISSQVKSILDVLGFSTFFPNVDSYVESE